MTENAMSIEQKRAERRLSWLKTCSPEDRQLLLQAMNFEGRYFADLRLVTAPIRKRLLEYTWQDDAGTEHKAQDDPPSLSLSDWVFTFHRFRQGMYGDCDRRWQTIRINRKLDPHEHESTLLHEMIHGYEAILSPAVREWLVLELYRAVSKHIPPARLNRHVDSSTHSVFHNAHHGPLFQLKSLDIDLRRGWPLGTTFAYGRPELFNPSKPKPVQSGSDS